MNGLPVPVAGPLPTPVPEKMLHGNPKEKNGIFGALRQNTNFGTIKEKIVANFVPFYMLTARPLSRIAEDQNRLTHHAQRASQHPCPVPWQGPVRPLIRGVSTWGADDIDIG